MRPRLGLSQAEQSRTRAFASWRTRIVGVRLFGLEDAAETKLAAHLVHHERVGEVGDARAERCGHRPLASFSG